MKRKLTFLLTALLLSIGLTTWGQSDYSSTYSSNVELTTAGGTNATTCKVAISDTQYDGIKVGTGSKGGTWCVTVPSGTTHLHLHAGSWKGVSGLSLDITGATCNPSSINLTANAGLTGNPPFTVTPNNTDEYFVIELSNINSETTLTFTTSIAKRFVVWGVNSEIYGPAPQQTVATPTFSPAGGTYTETQNVSISCATSGASIYYTTDGSTPTISSSVYSSPIAVSTTTTIKAMGVKSGMTNSAVASATYTFPAHYATISAWKAAHTTTSSEISVIDGDVTVVYQNGSSLFVQDATGALLLYGNVGQTYQNGDVISGGLTGSSSLYSGMIEFVPTATPAAGVTGTAVEPTVVSAAQINNNYSTFESQFVRINGITFDADHTFNISNTAGRKATFTQDGTQLTCFDNFKVLAGLQVNEGDEADIIGFVAINNGTKQIFPRSTDDIILNITPTETVATPTFNPEGGTFTEAQSVSIACATSGATIHYTTDGTTPSANSTVYSTPISVTETTTIKAIAMKEGMNNSGIAEATYTIETPSEPVTFTKVTNAGCINTTDHYLLVCESAGTAANGSMASSGLQAGNVTISNGSITTEVDGTGKPATFTLETANGGYYIKCSNGKYVNNASSTSISLGNNPSSVWAINSNDAGFILQNTSNNNRFLGGTNATATVYKAYATSNFGSYPLVVLYFDGTAPANPELTVSATQMEGFTYEQGAGPSATQNFTVSGSHLTSNIVITAPENFEICLTEDGSFASSLTLPFGEGTVANTPIYVRLAAGLLRNTYSGNLTVATTGTETQNIALSGSVTMSNAVATPTFSPAAGTFISTQSVSILCETEGATIYYTTNGETPTTESNVYSNPFNVSTTTTVKALAVKENYIDSEIATAEYTFPQLMTIAEARTLTSNEYALVEGIVTFIDSRSIYIQDATAGIVLYLNSNTVPADLAIGDEVRAYGRKTVYNGLTELTDINGSSEAAFVIISSDNELPLAAKTIAEIIADYNGGNMLQATRVSIENATIGSIDLNNNTPITQDGNTLNIYRIPNVEGMIEGDWVNVIGIIGCNNAPQLRVASSDDVEYTHRPTLSVNPGTVSGMTYEVEHGPSEIANFQLSGSYLVDNVYIFPSENFELSTTGSDLFIPESPTAVYPPQSGHFSGLKIYCRLKAGLEAGTYNELQTVVSRDADTVLVRLIGTVTENGGGEEGNYIRIADISQLTNGSQVVIAARYDENTSHYYAMPNTASGKPNGVEFTSTMSGSDEILPETITAEETNYIWTVSFDGTNYTFTNIEGASIGYGSSGTDFVSGGEKTTWTVAPYTADAGSMVPYHNAFSIINATTTGRGFALNNQYKFGAYATSNMISSTYNFCIDLFVKSEGPVTPVVATPTFTPAEGTYYEAQNVTINCSTEGATIYYTLDGSEPTTESSVYSTPIVVSESTIIKAMAVKADFENSAVATATYNIQLGVAVIFDQDWEGEMNGWTFVDVEGPLATWNIAQYSGNHYANINGYNKGANIDWCISPAFNLNNYENPVLSFKTAKNYNGQDLQVYFSNDYDGIDPTTATWTELSATLSEGSFTWAESGDIDLSNYSGTSCYIGFKYTCTEDEAAAWEIDDCLLVGQTSNPVVAVTPMTLNGFSYVEGNGPSAEQSFTISGMNLSNNITITRAEDYEISTTSGENFDAQETIVLTPSNGTIEETTIYVRLVAGLAIADYNEEISITCVDIDDMSVACNGSVTEEIIGEDYVRVNDLSVLTNGSQVILAARYDIDVLNGYYVMTAATSGKPTGVGSTTTMSGSDEILSSDITAEEAVYAWTVGFDGSTYTFTNASGNMLGYTSGTNFATNGDNTAWMIAQATASDSAAMVPGYTGFTIINQNVDTRAVAMNTSYNFGAYSTSNMTNGNGSDYNFYLDIFIKGQGGDPTVSAPVFCPAAGTFYEAQDVTITCATPEAEIFYSLESAEGPWTEYTEAITVDEDMTIWAYAEKEGYNNSAVVSAEYIIRDDVVIIFNQDWEGDWNGWTQVSMEGESEWTIAEHDNNHYAYMNAYNDGINEDWLISPAFDLEAYTNVVLNFRSAMNYNGPDIEVYFSNNYDGIDPTTASWLPLTCDLSQGSWTWTESGEISLDEFTGTNCHIAYKYTSTETEAAGWEIDDIMLTSGVNTMPTIMAAPSYINGFSYTYGEGPSEATTYELSAANLDGEGEILILVTEGFEISLDDETYGEELEIAYADGVITDQPVTVYVRMSEGLEIGEYEAVIMHEGGNAYTEVDLAGEVISAEQPYIDAFMPMYIQGNNGSNNNRVPVAIAVYLENLEPSTTYRYTNQFVDANDGETVAGAGNVIYTNADGFYRSTNPSLSTEGGYGEFTTDEAGEGFAWFINEPTANTRFTPGNQVFLRIRINDGHDGTTVDQIFTTEDYATVLNFGTENDEYQGTAFYAKSIEEPMNFVMMFSSDYDWRPTYSTSIETTGVDYASINQYADFYKEEVAGKDGYFGGIIPNVNEDGINIIWVLDEESYIIGEYYTENGDGVWGDALTANPQGGLDDIIFIDLSELSVDENVDTTVDVQIWNTKDEIIIENHDNARYSMMVYNILGQPVMATEIQGNSTERFSHNFAAGLYIVTMQNNENKVSAKIIVR